MSARAVELTSPSFNVFRVCLGGSGVLVWGGGLGCWFGVLVWGAGLGVFWWRPTGCVSQNLYAFRINVVMLHTRRDTLEGMPDIFGVIADATRRDILQVLLDRHVADSEISVSEIVNQLEISQPTVSKHLKVLRDAELVTVREEGQHRFYSLDPEPLEMVEDFVIPFLSVGFETEVTVEYLDGDGQQVTGPGEVGDGFDASFGGSAGAVIPEEAAVAAERIGRVAAAAEHRVKELVARFKLHG